MSSFQALFEIMPCWEIVLRCVLAYCWFRLLLSKLGRCSHQWVQSVAQRRCSKCNRFEVRINGGRWTAYAEGDDTCW